MCCILIILYFLLLRCLLHNCFQAVMDHGCPVASDLAQAYRSLCTSACTNSLVSGKNSVVHLGFALGLLFLHNKSSFEINIFALRRKCYNFKFSKNASTFLFKQNQGGANTPKISTVIIIIFKCNINTWLFSFCFVC